MIEQYPVRMLALAMARMRQRMRDDRSIVAMIEKRRLSLRASGGPLGRPATRAFREDLDRRILEAEELLFRMELAVSDEALVDAWEQTGGTGADAELLWGEIRLRGLVD